MMERILGPVPSRMIRKTRYVFDADCDFLKPVLKKYRFHVFPAYMRSRLCDLNLFLHPTGNRNTLIVDVWTGTRTLQQEDTSGKTANLPV